MEWSNGIHSMKLKFSLLTAFLFFIANLVMARSVAPQQFEMFKKLSPEQQIKRFGEDYGRNNKTNIDLSG